MALKINDYIINHFSRVDAMRRVPRTLLDASLISTLTIPASTWVRRITLLFVFVSFRNGHRSPPFQPPGRPFSRGDVLSLDASASDCGRWPPSRPSRLALWVTFSGRSAPSPSCS